MQLAFFRPTQVIEEFDKVFGHFGGGIAHYWLLGSSHA
jgi:hypothetical protein